MAVFIWVAIGVAAAFGLLPAVRPPRILLIPLSAILLLAAWTLLGLTWTESAERTFAEFARIIGYLGVLVLVWIGVGRRTWRLLAAGLLTAAVLVSVLVVASRLWPSAFPTDFVALRLGTTRISYPFGYWNAVGCWCAMTSTLCLAHAAHARSGLVRALALAAVPVCAVGLYLALSRAGFGGAILGAVVVVLLSRWRWLALLQTLLAVGASYVAILAVRQRPELIDATGTEGAWAVVGLLVALGVILGAVAWAGARYELGSLLKMEERAGWRLGVAGTVLALAVVVALGATFGERAWNEFTGRELVTIQTPDQRLTQLNGNRSNLWESAWGAFSSRPVSGHGPGTFEFWWSRNGTNAEFVKDVHNIYLEALAETGLVGLVLLLVFFAGLLWSAVVVRRRMRSSSLGVHAGLVGVFVVFLFQSGFDWMWESTAITVFALVAVATAASAMDGSRRGPRTATASVGLMLAAAFAVIVMVSGLATQRQIEKSQRAFGTGDPVGALHHADNAIDSQGWSAEAWGQRALALEATGRHEEAAVAINKAEQLEPYNWRWPLVATRMYVHAGDEQEAVRQYKRTKELRRHLAIFGVPRVPEE